MRKKKRCDLLAFKLLPQMQENRKVKKNRATYMGSNKISDHVKGNTPPNSSKNVAREVLCTS